MVAREGGGLKRDKHGGAKNTHEQRKAMKNKGEIKEKKRKKVVV